MKERGEGERREGESFVNAKVVEQYSRKRMSCARLLGLNSADRESQPL